MTHLVPWMLAVALMGCAANKSREAPREGPAGPQIKNPISAEAERALQKRRAEAQDPARQQCQIPEAEAQAQVRASLEDAFREPIDGLGVDILPFGAGMTRPEKIIGPIPQYTPEALRNRTQGIMAVKCIVTPEGTAQKCRIVKALTFMEEEVLRTLYCTRYRPITLQGKPVTVDYTFHIKISLPPR